MRKSKMWRMMTVAAVAASMTCGVFGVQSVSADDKKTLKVAMECGYAPYNWTQPDDSNGAVQISGSSDYAYGYDVMMAKKIADELGYDLEIVKLDWDSLVPAVQSGQVDCVIAGQSITKERQQMVDFTDPYYYASIITLVKNDGDYKDAASVEDLKGATVTSQQNTIWYDSCLPQIPDGNILPAQESAPAMLVALEAGKCDAVVTDMPTGKAACVAYPDFKLLDFTGTDGEFEVSDEDINIGISLKKGNDELKDAINGVLSEMTIPVDKNDSTAKKILTKIVKFILACYVEFFRGTPMMAQAMFIYFGSAAVFNINMSMWFAAIFIVSINTGAYMAETVRGGILSIDPGQTEGAKAIGMTHVQTMINVILPQALRNIMPQIGNNLIINIKDTCVLSIIGTVELFYTTKGVAGALYTYFESFTIAMIIYFIMTFTCSRILRVLEHKMDGPDNYDLATADTLTHTSGMYSYRERKDDRE